MDAVFHCSTSASAVESSRWSRPGVAEKMAQFEALHWPWISRREIAGQLDVPPRTLHYWVPRQWAVIDSSSWPKSTAHFFETPEGLDFLHQLALGQAAGLPVFATSFYDRPATTIEKSSR